MPPQSQGEGPKMISVDRLKESLKLRAQQDNNNKLPVLLEGETWNTKVESDAMKTEFVKNYTPTELGNKLRRLRPQVKGKNWFSLTELNERLRKMREMEDKEINSKGGFFKDIREGLVKLHISDSDKVKKNTLLRSNVLGELGKTDDFMLLPPKEQLVEKYFHPDNMSSSEKLKIELKRVRDEFKISESDCGSARVQVAQLTTKIKHLSATLHKKDKHSRKGLQGMVQQRKKLLKYLRRTDWDSYCLVLSRLGLRDNPDYKN